MKKFTIIILLLTILIYSLYAQDKYSLPEKKLSKPYATLSCKIDSFYYALQYYDDDLPEIEWFIEQIPVKKEKFFKINPDNTYSISDPFKHMHGGFIGQQARFDRYNKLFIQTAHEIKPVFYDENGFVDTVKLKNMYGFTISFGLNNELLLNTFNNYLDNNNITYCFFKADNPGIDRMAELFIREIKSGRVIICNGIAAGLKYSRTFEFSIINCTKKYTWKETSHSYVLIGYDIEERYFIAADNYGSIYDPYQPAFRKISFNELYYQITLIDKNSFDKSFSMGN